MRLKKVKLKNIGIHEAIERDLNHSSVAILGPNGSGKSTLVKAIKYVLTGETDSGATISDFVRITGDDDSPKSGVIELWFEHDGVDYYLRRSVPQGKNVLVINGDVDNALTKIKDIYLKIQEILNASTSTLFRVCFLAQGEIHNVLDGTQATRETNMVKFVGLDHCIKRAAAVDQRIKNLRETMVDYAPRISEQEETLRTATTRMEVAKRELDSHPDFSRQITFLQSSRDHLRDSARIHEELKKARENVEGHKQALDDTLKEHNVASLEAVTRDVEQTKTDLRASRDKLDRLLRAEDVSKAVVARRVPEAALKEASALLESARRAVTDLPTESSLRESIRIKELGETASSKQIPELVQMKNTREERERVLTEECTALRATVDDFNNRITECRITKSRIEQWIETRSKVCESDCENQCAMCGLQLSSDQSVSAKDVDDLRDQLKRADADLSKLVADMQENRRKLQEAEDELRSIRHQIRQIDADMQEATQNMIKSMSEKPIAELEALLEKRRKADQDIAVQQSQVNTHQRALNSIREPSPVYIEKVQEDVETYELVREFMETGDDKHLEKLSRVISETKQSIAQSDAYLERMQNVHRIVDVAQRNLTHSEENVKNLQAVVDKMSDEAKRIQATIPPGMKMESVNSVNRIDTEMAAYQSKQQDHLEKKAAYNQSVENHQQAEEKLKELKKAAEGQGKKADLLNELRKIKSVFDRDGLPLTYAQYVWNAISLELPKYLKLMDANFTVWSDPDTALNLKFCRTTTNDNAEMDMHLLSGGQRVKLALCFSIALQRLLMPVVEFLSVDEPSNHLDQASREGMAEMIRCFGRIMKSRNSQVLVVDHSVEVGNAVEKAYHLTNPGEEPDA